MAQRRRSVEGDVSADDEKDGTPATEASAMTNIIAVVSVVLATNVTSTDHQSGTERTVVTNVVERHVITYPWRGEVLSFTNIVGLETNRTIFRAHTVWVLDTNRALPRLPLSVRDFPPLPPGVVPQRKEP